MLSPTMVGEVRSLLAKGLPQRQIARQLGVSRGTVGAIAAGKHPCQDPARTAARAEREALERPVCENIVARCPGCGATVRMPCLACRLRGDDRGEH